MTGHGYQRVCGRLIGRPRVIVGEIQWATEQHVRGNLCLDEAVEAVQCGTDEAVSAARDADTIIFVGQPVAATWRLNQSVRIVELDIRHRETGVAGTHIADRGAGPP